MDDSPKKHQSSDFSERSASSLSSSQLYIIKNLDTGEEVDVRDENKEGCTHQS